MTSVSESDLPSATLPSFSLPLGMDIRSIVVSADDLGVWQRPEHVVAYERAVRCFRRAMRRHEKRARAIGLDSLASTLATVREGDSSADEGWLRRACTEVSATTLANQGSPCVGRSVRRDCVRRCRFFHTLAADACAKLATAHRAYQEAHARYDASAESGWSNVTFAFGTLNLVNPGSPYSPFARTTDSISEADVSLLLKTSPMSFGDGAGNRILCPACFRRLYPAGHEQKSCTHGCGEATCVECGARRRLDEPYWPCLGSLEKAR